VTWRELLAEVADVALKNLHDESDSLLASGLRYSDTSLRTRKAPARHDGTGSDSGGLENIDQDIDQDPRQTPWSSPPTASRASASSGRLNRPPGTPRADLLALQAGTQSSGTIPWVRPIRILAADSKTISTILKSADQIGNFWDKWGVSGGLLIIGALVAIASFTGRQVDSGVWTQSTFIASLAFAFVVLVLGFVAFANKENRSERTRGQAVEVYKIGADASVESQRIAAADRTGLQPPPPQPGASGGFKA